MLCWLRSMMRETARAEHVEFVVMASRLPLCTRVLHMQLLLLLCSCHVFQHELPLAADSGSLSLIVGSRPKRQSCLRSRYVGRQKVHGVRLAGRARASAKEPSAGDQAHEPALATL
jgi:hypothetical protein